MKKKIMIFMLLVAFLVGMMPDLDARAEDGLQVCFDKETKKLYLSDGTVIRQFSSGEWQYDLVEQGYNVLVSITEGSTGVTIAYACYESNLKLARVHSGNFFYFVLNDGMLMSREESLSTNKFYKMNFYWESQELIEYSASGFNCDVDTEKFYKYENANLCEQVVYCDTNIYNGVLVQNTSTNHDVVVYLDQVYYEVDNIYDFEEWCSDAGLNCAASSNETETTFPFAYDDEYWYIVRKNRVSGSEYTWYLSKINASDSWTHFLYSTERALSNSLIGVADLDEALTMESVNVAQYVYDAAGSGWLFVERPGYILQIGENYVDDIGITYSSAMPIVYSSTDIYSDKDKSSVSYATSTEFIDYDFVEPTPVPTPSITGGTSSVLNALTSVYANADMSSEIIDYLSAGTTVYIFGLITGESSGKSFYHIKYYTDEAIQEGYILSQYISSGSSGGSGSVDSTIGGDAKPGSYLDFIVTLYSMLWSRVFSIPMNVDGYSISMQQIVVYGALVVIVGGAVYFFLTGRKR